jgi:hypothetical protein
MPQNHPFSSAETQILPHLLLSETGFLMMKILQNLYTLDFLFFWRTLREEGFKVLLIRLTAELRVGGQKHFPKPADWS